MFFFYRFQCSSEINEIILRDVFIESNQQPKDNLILFAVLTISGDLKKNLVTSRMGIHYQVSTRLFIEWLEWINLSFNQPIVVIWQVFGVLLLVVIISCASLQRSGEDAQQQSSAPSSADSVPSWRNFFEFLFSYSRPSPVHLGPVYGHPFFFYSPTHGFSIEPYFDSYNFSTGFIGGYDYYHYLPFAPNYMPD